MATRFVELNFRADPEGGDIDPLKPVGRLDELSHAQHLILLIHGYNNTEDEARESYNAFMGRQAALVPDGIDWAFGATVVGVLWPGDARWGIARPAFYPWALPVADAMAGYLAALVRGVAQNGVGLALDVVAHSLGNRLLLELLQQLRGSDGLTIRSVLHMAAAVPTDRLDTDGDELRLGVLAETALGRATSIHSARDSVLSIWFPLGETIDVRTEGLLPTALGHQTWGGGGLLSGFRQQAQDDLRHQDYWSGLDAALVHEALNSPVAIARSVSTRTTARRDTDSVAPDEARATPSRDTGESTN
ncbi:alpha/beta hydrolase [Paucibacter sp. R3-3]|uniref:Alpha/beta hydrolase n=1 Tax=Roseateles agri TaxID=3098619 RepID=A0ABU5DJG5_9BURK|nr:alpha/beta hydrolase [Paucibacter sp. R3-3]MDY0746440.1 alpha/beta hydrolase [Paucibacter sp. R3-3]